MNGLKSSAASSTVISVTKNGKNIRATSQKNLPLPKDTLGELTQQARKRLRKGKTSQSQIRQSERMGCECGFWG
jgi:hypothetical protein